jgi:hypothetical protein
LDDLRGLLRLPATLGARVFDTVARDRQRAVKVIHLFGVELDGLLAAPA